MTKKQLPQELERRAPLQGKGESIPAVLSTSEPVRHWFGDVILDHSAGAVDLSRAEGGLILLDEHDAKSRIGRVDDVRLDGTVSRGNVNVIGTSDTAKQVKADIEAGVPVSVSVRFGIDEMKEPEKRGDPYVVTKWSLKEVSIVSVPADGGAGLWRSSDSINHQGAIMSKEGDTKGGDKKAPEDFPFQVVQGTSDQARASREQGRQEAAEIDQLFRFPNFQTPKFEQLRAYCMDPANNVTPAQASTWVAQLAGMEGARTSGNESVSNGLPPGFADGQRDASSRPATAPGNTGGEKTVEAMSWALEFRAGLHDREEDQRSVQKEAAENPYTGMSLVDMTRAYFDQAGVGDAYRTSAGQLVDTMLDRAAPILGDVRSMSGAVNNSLAGVLANTANKMIMINYQEAGEVWRPLARVTPGGIPDFKQGSRPAMSAFSRLSKIPPSGKYPSGKVSDVVEYIKAEKFGELITFSREDILGDDLGALAGTTQGIAEAAAATLGDEFWDLYLNPPTLNQDAKAIFDAAHNNTSGTAGGPSVDTLKAMRRLHRAQKDPAGISRGNIPIAFIVVPPVWETEAGVLVTAQQMDVDVTTTADAKKTVSKRAANQFSNLGVIVEGRLGGPTDALTAWFTQASPTKRPFLEVGFVENRQTPYIASREGWDVDGLQFKVRHEFAIAALDFRGITINAGA